MGASTSAPPRLDPVVCVDAEDIIAHPEITCYDEAICAMVALYDDGDFGRDPARNRLIGYTRHMDIMVSPYARLGDGRYLLVSPVLPLDFLGWDNVDIVDNIATTAAGVEIFVKASYTRPNSRDRHCIFETDNLILRTGRLHGYDLVNGLSFMFVSKAPLTEFPVSAREIAAGPPKLRQRIADGCHIHGTKEGRECDARPAPATYTPGEFRARLEPKSPFDADACFARIKKLGLVPRADANAKLD